MSDAPDRIWLQWDGDGDPEWDNVLPECTDVTWAAERLFPEDIPYRRDDLVADLERRYAEAITLMRYWKELEEAASWFDVEPRWDDMTGRRNALLAEENT